MNVHPKGSGHRLRAPRLILLAVLALLAVALVIRTAAVGVQPLAASVLPPRDHGAALRMGIRAFAAPGAAVPPVAVDAARQVAVSSPLAFEPFFVMAQVAAQQGRRDEALALMQETLKRRPNYLLTRLHLAMLHGQANQGIQAFQHLNFLLRYASGAHHLVLPELAKALSDEESRREIARLLAAEPAWRGDFLRTAQNAGVRPDHALGLLQTVRGFKGADADLGPERNLYLHSLVQAGAFAQARSLWLEGRGRGDPPADAYLTNGRFAAEPQPSLFSWTLHDGSAGRGDIVPGQNGSGELHAQYFGGQNTALAEQLLALSPGRYRLEYTGRMEGGEGRGRIFWLVACRPSQTQAARLEITGLGPQPRRVASTFSVPASGCAGQVLQLVAETGDVAGTVDLRLSDLKVIPA